MKTRERLGRRPSVAFLLLTLGGVLAAAGAFAAIPGVSYERVETPAMPSPVRCLVILPPSYASSTLRRYPVLYFLHDGYGDGRTLERRGVAKEALARMRDGRLPEFLIVAPDGSGSWFSDSHDGKMLYERFLTEDLPLWVASRYRVLSAQASRGVTGISMGGYGAIKTALEHPDLYGSVSSLAGALIPFGWKDLERYNVVARYSLKRIFGEDENDNSLDANDAWNVLWARCFTVPPFVVHMRGGTEDFYGLERVAVQYGMLLNERGVPTTVVIEPGNHDWSYWSRAMMDILQWHGRRFEYDAE